MPIWQPLEGNRGNCCSSNLLNVEIYMTYEGLFLQVMSHLMQVHKSITTLQGEDIVFLATDINLPGEQKLN